MLPSRRKFIGGLSASSIPVNTGRAEKENTHNQVQLKPRKLMNVLLIVMDQERSWSTLPDELHLPARENFVRQAVSFHNPHDVMWLDANGKQAKTRLLPGLVSKMRSGQDSSPFNANFEFPLPQSIDDDLSIKSAVQQLFVDQAQYFYGEQDIKDKDAHRRVLNYYGVCLTQSDDLIGKLLENIKALGFDENMVVVLTSGHGEMAGSHGLRHKGPFMYRENLNVPLAIRHPNGKTNHTSEALFSALDLAPTLLSLADIQTPDSLALRGYDHSSHVRAKKTAETREAILVNFSNTTQGNPQLDYIRMTTKRREKAQKNKTKFTFPEDFIQFENRTLGRGMVTNKYKFSRWFTPNNHHKPED